MKDKNNEPGTDKAGAKFSSPHPDLNDIIMTRILTSEQEGRTTRRKVKAIMSIYVGAIFFALVVLFFLKGLPANSNVLRMPALSEFLPGSHDLMVYYRLFAVSLVASLVAFVVFIAKSQRLDKSN